VRFDLGKEVGTAPTPLDARLIGLLESTAQELGLTTHRMPTVGHDTAMFSRAGIAVAMILVRNANGSHNPAEALERDHFTDGVRLLARAMERLAGTDLR
jgi:N-carbamoyl-L-amino-acid hydrolase